MKLIITLCVCVGVTCRMYGFGYYDSIRNGSRIPGLTARSTATGGTRSQPVSSAAALFLNPGELALIHGLTFNCNGGWLTWSESVTNTGEVNRVWRGGELLGTSTGAVSTEIGPMVFAAGLAKVADYDYHGIHAVLSPSSGWIDFTASGAQWEYLAGAAASLTPSISAGFSAGVRTAQGEFDYVFTDAISSERDSSAHWVISDRDFCWHAGVVATSDIVGAGISFASETEHHPRVIAVGGHVVSPHLRDLRTGFEMEFAGPSNIIELAGRLFLEYPLRSYLSLYASVHFLEEQETVKGSHGFRAGCGYMGGDRMGADIGFLFRTRRRGGSSIPSVEAERVDDNCVSVVGGVFCRM